MLLRAWVQQQSEVVSVWLWGSLQFTCRTKVALGSVSCTSAVGSHGLVSQPFPILWPRWADEMPHLQNRKAKWGGVCTKGQPDLPGLSLIQHADGITPVPIIPLNDAGCSGQGTGAVKPVSPEPEWHLLPLQPGWAGTPPVRQGAAAGRTARGRAGKPQK